MLLAAIFGIKFHDMDLDGVRDINEPGLAGWTIYRDVNNNGALDGGEPTTTTEANGAYAFSVLAGTHYFREVRQPGWAQTLPDPGPSGTEGFRRVTVRHLDVRTGQDFGNTQRLIVRGQKFHDADGDRIKDAGEAGLAGWTIYADADSNGQLGAGEVSAVTDASGNYALNLPARSGSPPFYGWGRYQIRELPQPGWTQTSPSLADYHDVSAAAGSLHTGVDFGNFRPASISGQTFEDPDRDGVRDPGEPGLAGWAVYLDQNDNDQLDVASATAGPFPSADVPKDIPVDTIITDPPPARSSLLINGLEGRYLDDVNVTLDITASRPDLPPASVRLWLTNPAGTSIELGAAGGDFRNTSLDDEAAAPLAGSAPPRTGSYRPASPLSAFDGGALTGVWTLTAIGPSGFFPPTLDGWSLTFQTGEPRTTTDAGGGYAFTGLAAGAYTVRAVNRPGWAATAPAGGAHRATLMSGQDVAGWDFATRRHAVVVGRHVFYNNSFFDGRDAGADSGDDGAIAPDKQALLAAAAGSFAGVTSYARGINGIMVDLSDVADVPRLEDFIFRTGRGPDVSAWSDAPVPSAITLRRGAGARGYDRVTLVWPDGAIANEWLQVTVKATANTGLASPDVFSFGNLVGETGDTPGAFRVNARDLLALRQELLSRSDIAGRYDFNRDGGVNVSDLIIARGAQRTALAAPPVTPAPPAALAVEAPAVLRDESADDLLA